MADGNSMANLPFFEWNSAMERLEVTWDSSQPNSFLYLPLDQTLNKEHLFTLRFTLELDQLEIGVDPEKRILPDGFGLDAWKRDSAPTIIAGLVCMRPLVLEASWNGVITPIRALVLLFHPGLFRSTINGRCKTPFPRAGYGGGLRGDSGLRLREQSSPPP